MAQVSEQTSGEGGSTSAVAPALLFLALGLAGTIALFWSGLGSLFDAWRRPEYSHGPLIPVISAFLLLRQLRESPIPQDAPLDGGRDGWAGVIAAVLAVVLATIGNLARIPDLVTYALILWGGALLLARYGWRRGRALWPPVLHLVFMLPLPAFLFWKVSIGLQFVSSEIGVAFIRMMGVPVFLGGNVIDLGVYKLHVAEACSGLRYLFPILSFSYVFAVLYRGPMWHKAVLLLSAVPIAILMNSLRIGVIGFMVDRYGIEHAEGFVHLFEGWVIFGLCILVLLGLALLLIRLRPDRKSLGQTLDLDVDGLAPQAASLIGRGPTRALRLCVALVLAVGVIWQTAPAGGTVSVPREEFNRFPRVIDDWRAGAPERLPPLIAAVLGADDYHSVTFARPGENAPVEFFAAYYDKLTEGSGIHSPEVCIPAGGWEMSRIAPVSIPAAGDQPALRANRAVIQKGLDRKLVYYWFEQRGRRLTSDYVAKAYTVWDAVTRGRTDGALVRLITPIAAGESEAEAEARLRRFLSQSFAVLPRFVPE